MRCPFCAATESKVVDSRVTQGGDAIRRRRECLECQSRFTTYERLEEMFPRVIKSNGRREDYEREKVMRGLKLACSKRPVSTEQLEDVLDRVEARLLALGVREVESSWIGQAVTEELRDLDPVAYIRFASVYRAFDDIQEFLSELRQFNESSEDEEA